MVETILRHNKAVRDLLQELGRDPSLEEIAAKLGTTVDSLISNINEKEYICILYSNLYFQLVF